MFRVVNVAALFVMAIAAAYFFVAAGLGVRHLRRQGVPLGVLAGVGYGHPFALEGSDRELGSAGSGWHLFFLVPCLNEAAVIGATVAGLVASGFPGRVVVIDDGCDDATAAEAQAAGRDGVTVVTRRGPDARRGKGAALNFGFAQVCAEVRRLGLDPASVVVCVMDADGRLSDGALRHVLPLFDDPAVGAVQLAVRIRNRATNFWLRFQDHQFWTLSSLTQYGRVGAGTVSLGGNGQFARLSALLEVGAAPWSASLTEDLDLALSLGIRGWRLTSTAKASVDQQGLAAFGPLVRQRTRWYQGHMTAGRRLPEVFRSTKMTDVAAVEMALYLLVPWMIDLPWSILYHLILLELVLDATRVHLVHGKPFSVALAMFVWYLLGFWPAIVTSILAKRRGGAEICWWPAIKLGHAFVLTNYLSYLCCWRALARMIAGNTAWTKTARLAEAPGFAVSPLPVLPVIGRLAMAAPTASAVGGAAAPVDLRPLETAVNGTDRGGAAKTLDLPVRWSPTLTQPVATAPHDRPGDSDPWSGRLMVPGRFVARVAPGPAGTWCSAPSLSHLPGLLRTAHHTGDRANPGPWGTETG